jgi:diguanylate cyclase (GGDEF)-like protein
MDMLHFTQSAGAIAAALPVEYDPVLVVLSYLVAALASYTGLLMSERIAGAPTQNERRAWLFSGACVMGIGVWAMHFTGMLALRLPIPVDYRIDLTILSAVPAALASGVALYVMAQRRSHHRRTLIGGTLIGAGIGIMHYIGMEAMHLEAHHAYEPGLFALSILVAVVLGIAALYTHELRHELFGWHQGRLQLPIAAALMGLAIAGMHYTAMAGVHFFFPGPPPSGDHATFGTDWLSLDVAVVSLFVILIAIVATKVGQRFEATRQRSRVDRRRMFEAIDSITDGFVLFDDEGQLVMANRVFQQMYPGLGEVLKPGTPYSSVISAWARMRSGRGDAESAEVYVAECLRHFKGGNGEVAPQEDQLKDGRWIYVRQQPVAGGGMVGVWTDVTPIKKLQTMYERQATHDALTGLANRQLFTDRLEHAIAHAKRQNRTLPLLFVDLDKFKPINDTHGHEVGDLVLKEVAMRLLEQVRDSDTVARLGGDEFVVLMEPYGERYGAEALAHRIVRSLSQAINVAGRECFIGASVGVGLMPPELLDRDELIKLADEAMYDAKRKGGNSLAIRAA